MQFYASFDEKGYHIEAYTPTTDDDPVAFEIRILVGDELKKSIYVPMTHMPVFGIDVDDHALLEKVAADIMAVLPESVAFDDSTKTALTKIEEGLGGAAVREQLAGPPRHASWPRPFEGTRGQFKDRIAEALGGQEAADQWMATQLPELDGKSPDEALAIGMIPEILRALQEELARRA